MLEKTRTRGEEVARKVRSNFTEDFLFYFKNLLTRGKDLLGKNKLLFLVKESYEINYFYLNPFFVRLSE